MSAIFFAALLYMPQFLQKVLGYSPLKPGVGLLPMMGTFAVVSFVAGPLYNRLGAKPIVIARRRLPGRGAVPALARRRRLGLRSRSCPGWWSSGFGVGLFYPIGHHRRR